MASGLQREVCRGCTWTLIDTSPPTTTTITTPVVTCVLSDDFDYDNDIDNDYHIDHDVPCILPSVETFWEVLTYRHNTIHSNDNRDVMINSGGGSGLGIQQSLSLSLSLSSLTRRGHRTWSSNKTSCYGPFLSLLYKDFYFNMFIEWIQQQQNTLHTNSNQIQIHTESYTTIPALFILEQAISSCTLLQSHSQEMVSDLIFLFEFACDLPLKCWVMPYNLYYIGINNQNNISKGNDKSYYNSNNMSIGLTIDMYKKLFKQLNSLLVQINKLFEYLSILFNYDEVEDEVENEIEVGDGHVIGVLSYHARVMISLMAMCHMCHVIRSHWLSYGSQDTTDLAIVSDTSTDTNTNTNSRTESTLRLRLLQCVGPALNQLHTRVSIALKHGFCNIDKTPLSELEQAVLKEMVLTRCQEIGWTRRFVTDVLNHIRDPEQDPKKSNWMFWDHQSQRQSSRQNQFQLPCDMDDFKSTQDFEVGVDVDLTSTDDYSGSNGSSMMDCFESTSSIVSPEEYHHSSSSSSSSRYFQMFSSSIPKSTLFPIPIPVAQTQDERPRAFLLSPPSPSPVTSIHAVHWEEPSASAAVVDQYPHHQHHQYPLHSGTVTRKQRDDALRLRITNPRAHGRGDPVPSPPDSPDTFDTTHWDGDVIQLKDEVEVEGKDDQVGFGRQDSFVATSGRQRGFMCHEEGNNESWHSESTTNVLSLFNF
eukprot:gene711-1364_t